MTHLLAAANDFVFGGAERGNRQVVRPREAVEEDPPPVDLFSSYALERLETGFLVLEDHQSRQELDTICRELHEARSAEDEVENCLNLQYALEAAQRGSICIYSAQVVRLSRTDRSKTKKTYDGLIIGRFETFTHKRTFRTTLLFHIDVVLAKRGCGKKVMQPLLNMEFKQFATRLNTCIDKVEFDLNAIKDPDVISFYEKHEFVRVISEGKEDTGEEALVPMKQLKKFPRLLMPY